MTIQIPSKLTDALSTISACFDLSSHLEKAKSKIEKILDNIDPFFVIIDGTGQIYKGNFKAASYFSSDIEELFQKNLFELFRPESRNIFKKNLHNVIDEEKTLDFELPIDFNQNIAKDFVWNISLYSKDNSLKLYTVMGYDVSLVKIYERQLFLIFTCIPLGVFTIDKSLSFNGPYSAYTEYLLDNKRLENTSLIDALFLKSSQYSQEKYGEWLDQMSKVMGSDILWFDSIKDYLPAEIYLDKIKNPKWIGIYYHPIVRENQIEQILFVLEDRTDIVKVRQETEKRKIKEDLFVTRILDLQQCKEEVLILALKELSVLQTRLPYEIKSQSDISNSCMIIHGIKGLSRIAGLSRLKNLAHQTEEILLSGFQIEDFKNSELSFHVTQLKLEIQEILSLHAALSKKNISNNQEDFINSVDYTFEHLEKRDRAVLKKLQDFMSRTAGLNDGSNDSSLKEICLLMEEKLPDPRNIYLADLSSSLMIHGEKTASQLMKKLNLQIVFESISIKRSDYSLVLEVLFHMLTNAIDHGIELPAERLKNNKPEAGHLRITAKFNIHNSGQIDFTFEDDGSGMSALIIGKKALENEIITEEHLRALSEEDTFNLVFESGLSTARKVTDISGRGIGLDIVKENITKNLRGKIHPIKTKLGFGTTFSFSIYC